MHGFIVVRDAAAIVHVFVLNTNPFSANPYTIIASKALTTSGNQIRDIKMNLAATHYGILTNTRLDILKVVGNELLPEGYVPTTSYAFEMSEDVQKVITAGAGSLRGFKWVDHSNHYALLFNADSLLQVNTIPSFMKWSLNHLAVVGSFYGSTSIAFQMFDLTPVLGPASGLPILKYTKTIQTQSPIGQYYATTLRFVGNTCTVGTSGDESASPSSAPEVLLFSPFSTEPVAQIQLIGGVDSLDGYRNQFSISSRMGHPSHFTPGGGEINSYLWNP